MSRELLLRMLKLIDEVDVSCYQFGRDLERDIRAELEKPEPVDCGKVEVLRGYAFGLRANAQTVPYGTYKLLAVRIEDAPTE